MKWLRIILVACASALPIGLSALPGTADAQEALAQGPLDGMVFVGKIGPKGAPDLDDELHFQDGKFWSVNCIECGFQPGAYWVRRVGDAVRFRGELTGERGTLAYAGEVVGDRIEVSINWTKSRWYWRIDRELEFSGTFKPSALAYSVERAITTATTAQPELVPACTR